MSPRRSRTIVDDTTRPFLPRHVRLHHCPVRKAWAVLAPERVYWPDEISLDILRKCDGETPAGGIVDLLAAEYDAPADEIRADVVGFLQEYSDRLLLHCRTVGAGS